MTNFLQFPQAQSANARNQQILAIGKCRDPPHARAPNYMQACNMQNMPHPTCNTNLKLVLRYQIKIE